MERPNEGASEIPLAGGGRTAVSRRGPIVFREAGEWTPTVHALLRHLERTGFAAAPRVAGSGFDPRGRETLTYIEGESVHPGPWSDEAVAAIGRMLRELHTATASFRPPGDACWRPWFGRALGGPEQVIGHCDTGPWNILARDGRPVALVDWEAAGPLDPAIELAQACWLNAQLHDDDIAERVRLPAAAARFRQVRLLADAYRLPAAGRVRLAGTIIEFAVHAAANEAIEAHVTPDSLDPAPLWGIAWRARGAAWLLRHRPLLEQALA
jgi:Ser/Thr protein kinase RdoA (MazF antagonist)